MLVGSGGDFGTASSFQVGAGTGGSNQITVQLDGSNMQVETGGINLSGADITQQTTALDAIGDIDDAMIHVNEFRSNLGAVQNRLGAAVNNLENAGENATESRSRLQDADIAKEAAELTQNNVLRQASTAMLSQANQNPQLALQLLGGGGGA
ncbi:MAG: flagellin [Desulfohalobiaceae bacterium]